MIGLQVSLERVVFVLSGHTLEEEWIEVAFGIYGSDRAMSRVYACLIAKDKYLFDN